MTFVIHQYACPALALGLLLSACAFSPVAESLPARSVEPTGKSIILQPIMTHNGRHADYRIGKNDLLEITVFEQLNMNATVRVSGDGTISFPPLEPTQVEGLTDRQLAALLEEELRNGYLKSPHLTVSVVERHARRADIMGEIRTPGNYALDGEERLSDLISKAGGLSSQAGSTGFLIRQGESLDAMKTGAELEPAVAAGGIDNQCLRIDLAALLLKGDDTQNVIIRDGDMVNVPSAGFVHVTGPGIEKPGSYPLRFSPTTLDEIIDQAGGMRFAADGRIIVYRAGDDGEPQAIIREIDAMTADGMNDLDLRAGDRILVESSWVKAPIAAAWGGISRILRASISWSLPIG